KSAVLEYSYLIFRYLITFMIFEIFLRNNPAILARGHLFLMFIVGIYFLTALWEIITFNHLPSSRLYQSMMPIPTGPFYNENNLAAFLLLLFPMMLFFARLVPNIWGKIVSVSSTVLFLAVITIQGARIAMLISAAALGVFFIFFMKKRYRLLSLAGIALALFMFVQIFPVQAKIGAGLLEHELGSLRSETETVKMSSVKIRKHLIGEIFELTAESKFMGLGGGNIERHMSTDRTHRTAGIINAHNWMLELMGNFGVIPLMIFAYLYLKWLHLLWQKYREAEGRLKTLYMSYIWVLILFIPASVLPSSICWYNNYWIVFAAINALCHTPSSQIKEHI
ncbi:MAG TPA: O-antigen ligase family protein, partial [Candidatus Cloacimonetes bacterium]|nr:O-antigen ligase family protein [Candidatus Cloacimonadota bacterium]